MFEDLAGPIERYEWGRFQINGKVHSEDGEGVGKDIFMVENVVSDWEERKGHRVKRSMVRRALNAEVQILVIGNGANGALVGQKKTRQAIADAGIERLIIKKTPEACAEYNQLVREGKRVALLAHGTC